MFKLNKLEQVQDENIDIDYVNVEQRNYKDKTTESFKTLRFSIEGTLNNKLYALSFELNCRLEELLKIPECETIDFKKYIFDSETMFYNNGITDLEPEIKITANRWIKNKFIVMIHFYANDDEYSGVIEFEFNLDDYL